MESPRTMSEGRGTMVATAVEAETTLRALRASVAFTECSDEQLMRILPLLSAREVPAGTVLVREGEPWGALYARHGTLVAPIVSHALLGWWTLFVLGFDHVLV